MADADYEELLRLLREEQRRREKAEQLVKDSQPQTLQQYLEACHSLSLNIQVVTDRSLTTQGDTTNPTGRICPRRIIPWDDFALDFYCPLACDKAYHSIGFMLDVVKRVSKELVVEISKAEASSLAVLKKLASFPPLPFVIEMERLAHGNVNQGERSVVNAAILMSAFDLQINGPHFAPLGPMRSEDGYHC